MPEDVRRDAALMAALRKWPDDIRTGKGVEGSGCVVDTRKGGGTSRSVSG